MAIIGASIIIISAAAFTMGGAIRSFRSSDTERHNKAMEKLSNETVKYNKEKQIALEYINYQLKLHQDAMSDFNDINAALERYNELLHESKLDLGYEPKLSDYYDHLMKK